MPRTRRRKCLHCQVLFRADSRNRSRQKYCSAPACRRAAKAARQRRWLTKPENQNYFRDPQNAARERAWQRDHPGYWRNTTRAKRRTLQDACPAQAIEPPQDSAALTLQDTLARQGPVLLGLIAHLIDSTLQDDIAATSQRLLQLGQDILGGEVADAPQTRVAP
jgi:hypothetical protein